MLNIAIFGSTGAIGNEFTKQLAANNLVETINCFNRAEVSSEQKKVNHYQINFDDEAEIAKAAEISAKTKKLDIVIVAIGALHTAEFFPEKSIRELDSKKFTEIYHTNTVIPALIGKYFLPHLNKNEKSIFAVLSARVGSISDNQLGGWYAYRASKAALNMIIKNFAIEINRVNKKAVILGLHPGTVDSSLSKPFQAHVKEGHLFSPEYAVKQLLQVIYNSDSSYSGKLFAYDDSQIPF
ncbi:MAG: SDR family NAD(P)-dependent oxidoreductase [Rickettsiales bacterium]